MAAHRRSAARPWIWPHRQRLAAGLLCAGALATAALTGTGQAASATATPARVVAAEASATAATPLGNPAGDARAAKRAAADTTSSRTTDSSRASRSGNRTEGGDRAGTATRAGRSESRSVVPKTNSVPVQPNKTLTTPITSPAPAPAQAAAPAAPATPAAPAAPAAPALPAISGLNATQIANAAVIVSVGRSLGAGTRGEIIAVATALQESNLKNYTVAVDHDSLGLFQQRPSAGWGSPAQLTDPAYAARKFYQSLLRSRGDWECLTCAAQRVQGSAFPDAYAKHEGYATAIVAALGG